MLATRDEAVAGHAVQTSSIILIYHPVQVFLLMTLDLFWQLQSPLFRESLSKLEQHFSSPRSDGVSSIEVSLADLVSSGLFEKHFLHPPVIHINTVVWGLKVQLEVPDRIQNFILPANKKTELFLKTHIDGNIKIVDTCKLMRFFYCLLLLKLWSVTSAATKVELWSSFLKMLSVVLRLLVTPWLFMWTSLFLCDLLHLLSFYSPSLEITSPL